jgi:N-acetylglutamate synthase-like GNAT family acetyltransferase
MHVDRSDVTIERYSGQSADEIFDLILPIQQAEFGLPVSRESQPDLDDIPAFYQQGAGDFWLARRAGQVIGTIALKDIGDRAVALRKMFVRADFRGREHGIARHLLETALASAKQKDVSVILLGTTAFFHAAHRFYEKNGFVEIGKQDLPPAFPIMTVDTKFYRRELS